MLIFCFLQLVQSIYYEDMILFHWKGNLTSNSITLKIFTKQDVAINFRIISWKRNQLDEFQLTNFKQPFEDPITYQWENLETNEQYFYFFDFDEVNITQNYLEQLNREKKNYIFEGTLKQPLFSFTTFGTIGTPFNFNFSMSGCARSASTSEIFVDIYTKTYPQFFFMLGDLHYRDITIDSFSEFDFAYKLVFQSITQRYLYQQVPFEYQFDDHDFGKNDADGNSPTREVANQIYWEYVPHSNLHNYAPLFTESELQYLPQEISEIKKINETNIGTYRYKVIGRTVLITVDLRTFQNLEVLGPEYGEQQSQKSLLGKQQRNWLVTVFNKIKQTEWVKAVIFISSVNFHGETWEMFPVEQLLVADNLEELQENLGKQVLIVSSDSHMTAMKNGKNSFIQNLGEKYSYGLQEVMCGSLDKPGSCKTQSLTYGPWLGKDHFTNVKIQDSIYGTCLIIRGYEKQTELFNYNTCDEVQRNIEQTVKCPFDALLRIAYVVGSLIVSFGFLITIYLIVKKCHKESMKYSQIMREVEKQ